jgi:hypothetical protein
VGQVFLGDVLSHWTVFVWKMEIKKVFFGFPSCETSEFFIKKSPDFCIRLQFGSRLCRRMLNSFYIFSFLARFALIIPQMISTSATSESWKKRLWWSSIGSPYGCKSIPSSTQNVTLHSKIGWRESKHAGLAQQNGFGPQNGFPQFGEIRNFLLLVISHLVHSVINIIWLLLPVSDWLVFFAGWGWCLGKSK